MASTSPGPTPRWASLAEAAEHLGVHERTLRRMMAAGSIRGWRFGPKIIRVDVNELDAALRPIPITGLDAA